MLRTLVLNFCLLVTLVYLLSLTYKSAADLADSHLQRNGMMASGLKKLVF